MTAELHTFKPYDNRILIRVYWRLTKINIVSLHRQSHQSDFSVEVYLVDLVENEVWLVDSTSFCPKFEK